MEIRDPVHGSIHILDEEVPIIRDPFFQRLRNIKQLGFTEYIFPGATHTRFLHSIGVMYIGEKAFNSLFKNHLKDSKILRMRETFKLACLLHDIGHAPLSHSTESVMPPLKSLELPKEFMPDSAKETERQATHEDYTIKTIVDSSFSNSLEQVEKTFGIDRTFIADLIIGKTRDCSYFEFEGTNYFPLLHQLVSSEMDADRMDYLLRDSYFCGVSYGNFDLDWLIDNLEACPVDNKAYLGISERAVVTFDDFLLSRFHMFLMVYFHYRAVCLEQLLFNYFRAAPKEYSIPSDIEKYIDHDDHYLMKILRKSDNRYAKSIVQNKIPQKIFESFNEYQLAKLEVLQKFLEKNKLDYIRSSSSGRLSKYYSYANTPKFSLKVSRSFHGAENKIYSNIEDTTDLFQKFSKSHAVNRLHCNIDELPHKLKNELLDMINS